MGFVKSHAVPDVLTVSFPSERCYVNMTLVIIVDHMIQTLTLLCAQYDLITSHWNKEEDDTSTGEEKHTDYMGW